MRTLFCVAVWLLTLGFSSVSNSQNWFEPDNTQSQAKPLPDGALQVRALVPSNDTDFIRVSIRPATSRTVVLRRLQPQGSNEFEATLFAPSGSQTTQSFGSNSQSSAAFVVAHSGSGSATEIFLSVFEVPQDRATQVSHPNTMHSWAMGHRSAMSRTSTKAVASDRHFGGC